MDSELVHTNAVQPDPPALTRPDLIAAWLSGRKQSTVIGYRQDLNHFARSIGQASGAAAIELLLGLPAGDANAVVLSYRNAMLEPTEQAPRGLSSATIARRLAALRSVVKLARTLGRVTWSIEIEAPRHEARKDVRGPDEEEMKRVNRVLAKLRSTPRGLRDRAIVYLLFGIALRRGELASLDLQDVDFIALSVRVVRKGKREKTTLVCDPKVISAVKDWVVARGTHPGALFPRTDRPGSEARLTGAGIRRVVERIGKAAKLPRGLWPHALRHAGITICALRTENPLDIAAFSGHARIQTAMGYHDRRADAQSRMARAVARNLK